MALGIDQLQALAAAPDHDRHALLGRHLQDAAAADAQADAFHRIQRLGAAAKRVHVEVEGRDRQFQRHALGDGAGDGRCFAVNAQGPDLEFGAVLDRKARVAQRLGDGRAPSLRRRRWRRWRWRGSAPAAQP
jgi:hypothetical protein